MRMRRKKNIVKRIEDCSRYLTVMCESEKDSRVVSTDKLIDFNEFFGNGNPVVLEIGCGKAALPANWQNVTPILTCLQLKRAIMLSLPDAKKQEKKVYITLDLFVAVQSILKDTLSLVPSAVYILTFPARIRSLNTQIID